MHAGAIAVVLSNEDDSVSGQILSLSRVALALTTLRTVSVKAVVAPRFLFQVSFAFQGSRLFASCLFSSLFSFFSFPISPAPWSRPRSITAKDSKGTTAHRRRGVDAVTLSPPQGVSERRSALRDC